MAKKGLGRGLDHLLEQNNILVDEPNNNNVVEVKLKDIKPNPYQPRKYFDNSSLEELALSIQEQGLFQPILVRESIVGYEIISGERRYRASKIAQLESVPVIIYDYTDAQMMEVAIVENIQREDLTVVEEAKSYKMIMENMNYTQEELSKKVGKSRSHVANILRILNLEEEILDLIDKQEITMGHVKMLIPIEDKEKRKKIINQILDQGLTVRAVEEIIKEEKGQTSNKKSKSSTNESKHKRIENIMREKLDTKVIIKGKSKGTIEITYNSENDLERLLEELKII